MESKFADLRWRDASVSMLRVKQSRRRSQSQKENRERMVNTRRQLGKLQELELSSLDASMVTTNLSTIQEKTQINAKAAKTTALDRLKRLQSWKEQKVLKKEKERREKESKGVFKIGLYQPKDSFTFAPLPVVPPASSRPKENKGNTALSQNTRVTRSMKQARQEPQKPLVMHPNTRANKVQPPAERLTRSRAAPVTLAPASTKTGAGYPAPSGPGGQALSSRSANRPPVTRPPLVKDNPKAKCADVRTTRSRTGVSLLSAPAGGVRNCKAPNITAQPDDHKDIELMEPQVQEPEKIICPPSPTRCPEKKDMVVNQAEQEADPAVDSSSFAPQGFVFQAPAGLLSYKLEPFTPRSADAFLTPSSSFNLPPAPVFSGEPPAKPSPTKTPRCSPLHASPTFAPSTSGSPQESKHDVPYFRSTVSNETERLTNLCLNWESKVEDESIPEEMRDQMRTAIGQARLLMKKRFKQFSGLVDDCDLGRGEKITTCTDLQGFWDMVYFQVEDVNRRFESLKEAEGRGWVEELKRPPQQRKVIKKTSAAPAKPTGNKAAAKSRLAAVKAAMRAQQQAAEAKKAGKDEANTDDAGSSQQPQAEGQTVVFDGGFFQVESPAKPSIRRSSCLTPAALPRASPQGSYLTPRRVTRRSLASAQTCVHANASPAQPGLSAGKPPLAVEKTPGSKSQRGSAQASQKKNDAVKLSLCFSAVEEVLSDEAQSGQSPKLAESVPKLEEAAFVAELGAHKHELPTISVEKMDFRPSEDMGDVSPRLSQTPCKTPQPPSALSFTLSPCGSPGQASISSPAELVPMEAQVSVSPTSDGSAIEELPGLDFERYLQPSQRCSLSPGDTVAMEMLPSGGADVEMESPRGQPEELLTHLEPALSTVSSVFTPQSPQVQTAESAMLLFTPALKDRIRQSTCPNDLMVFTPPNL
uniref:Discs, large (Drosophila) homolog-associated protein 5 n=1 Tax=Fundulus heteroclitus TaxID=8078 RepID=A0A3Q2UMG7_FUNHE